MANVDRPYGFKPTKSVADGWLLDLDLAAANSVIGRGDLVIATTAGSVDVAAATATQIVGVANEYKAASSGGKIQVLCDPFMMVRAQGDDGTATALTGMFGNYNIVATAASATTKQSLQEFDSDSIATTSTLPLKAIRLWPDPNNAFGEFNQIEFIINNHALKSLGVDGLAG